MKMHSACLTSLITQEDAETFADSGPVSLDVAASPETILRAFVGQARSAATASDAREEQAVPPPGLTGIIGALTIPQLPALPLTVTVQQPASATPYLLRHLRPKYNLADGSWLEIWVQAVLRANAEADE